MCNYNNLISHVQTHAIIKTLNKKCCIKKNITKTPKPKIQTHFWESQELFDELEQLGHMSYEETFTSQTIKFIKQKHKKLRSEHYHIVMRR